MSRPMQRQYIVVVEIGMKIIQTTNADKDRITKGMTLYIISVSTDLIRIKGGRVDGVFSAYSGAN